MDHIGKAPVRDLRSAFKKIECLRHWGERYRPQNGPASKAFRDDAKERGSVVIVVE